MARDSQLIASWPTRTRQGGSVSRRADSRNEAARSHTGGPLVDAVGAMGAVELERVVAALECIGKAPVGDLEELSGEIAADVLRRRMENVDRGAGRGGWRYGRCKLGDRTSELGTVGERTCLLAGGLVVGGELLVGPGVRQPAVGVAEIDHA